VEGWTIHRWQRRRPWSARFREALGAWVVRHGKDRKIGRSANAVDLDSMILIPMMGRHCAPRGPSSFHRKHPKDLVCKDLVC
jgi:hypothetical protein